MRVRNAMSNVLALIPARLGSKGIPSKNFAPLAGCPPIERAYRCAHASADYVAITTDATNADVCKAWRGAMAYGAMWIPRPSELAQDDTPMIAVVKHALKEIPGPPDQIVVLLQPTQPLRKPEHVKAAITLLQETQVDSVVSVVELPLTHSPDLICTIVSFPDGDEKLRPWPLESIDGECMRPWSDQPTRRQNARPAYIRDGTVYAFYRCNLSYGHIYGPGDRVRPLVIPASETCPLDTPEDWQRAEELLRGRNA